MGLAVSDLIGQIRISEQTFYCWKKFYGGPQSEQVLELKQFVDEKTRLKKLVAELSLNRALTATMDVSSISQLRSIRCNVAITRLML